MFLMLLSTVQTQYWHRFLFLTKILVPIKTLENRYCECWNCKKQLTGNSLKKFG